MVSLSDRIIDNPESGLANRKKPEWLRAKLPGGSGYRRLRAILNQNRLHTVCEAAKCPNLGECWERGTATIMILGDICTRSCGFCHITTGRPGALDVDEPRRVAASARLMNLRHIVITSVNRDELDDGGAGIWAQTIDRIRQQCPDTRIEVLIPDFQGDWSALQRVIDQRPDILNHNLETVRRLYRTVRPQARYDRSIELLQRSKAAGLTTKTGIMVGIGEADDEVEQLMGDVLEGARSRAGEGGSCDILTIGQYLQPTRHHLPVDRWVTPLQFRRYKAVGEALGFGHVESGPLVRSSYHADKQVKAVGVSDQ